MRKPSRAAALLLAAALCLAGCAREAEPVLMDGVDQGLRETVTVADPAAALEGIYETLPESRTQPLTAGLFTQLFPDLEGEAEEYFGRVSDVSGGLSDVIIIQPSGDSKSSRDLVRDALRRYQDKRIQEFENFDILDAFAIATEADVFDQGDYVILLMLPNLEDAREMLDRHIPL